MQTKRAVPILVLGIIAALCWASATIAQPTGAQPETLPPPQQVQPPKIVPVGPGPMNVRPSPSAVPTQGQKANGKGAAQPTRGVVQRILGSILFTDIGICAQHVVPCTYPAQLGPKPHKRHSGKLDEVDLKSSRT